MREKLPTVIFISIFTILVVSLVVGLGMHRGQNEVAAQLLSLAERAAKPDQPQTLTRAQICSKCGEVDRKLCSGAYESGAAYQGKTITIDRSVLAAAAEKYRLMGYGNAEERSTDYYLRLETRALLAEREGIEITDAELEEEIELRVERALSELYHEDTVLYLAGGGFSLSEALDCDREEIRKELAGNAWEALVRAEFMEERDLLVLTDQTKEDLRWEIENRIATALKEDGVKAVK